MKIYKIITVHCVTQQWEFFSCLLSCFSYSENLSEEINKILNEWTVQEKIVVAVTDNGDTVASAVRLDSWLHIACFAHSLNWIVQHSHSKQASTLQTLQWRQFPDCHYPNSCTSCWSECRSSTNVRRCFSVIPSSSSLPCQHRCVGKYLSGSVVHYSKYDAWLLSLRSVPRGNMNAELGLVVDLGDSKQTLA